MIIEYLIDFITAPIAILVLLFHAIPDIPSEIQYYITQFLDYIEIGFDFTFMFLDVNMVLVGISAVIYMEGAYLSYKIVMWVINKLPLGID
ncbi:MAG: hypothetical protein QXI16_07040 [Sulfolobaceae archaeon]